MHISWGLTHTLCRCESKKQAANREQEQQPHFYPPDLEPDLVPEDVHSY